MHGTIRDARKKESRRSVATAFFEYGKDRRDTWAADYASLAFLAAGAVPEVGRLYRLRRRHDLNDEVSIGQEGD